ncbi:hypothetical protein EBH_0037540 [Eimeria brunetti]|uniref:Tf2-1-like SH3-like domain-containing protein n=1 Tax=Eimeria brunetti TaxID=51314 RepID=U6LQT4_9EIME|nr:hypothetical protein EBH_0037540 [Eimeria brunetti]
MVSLAACRILERMLRAYIQTDEREWERLLPGLELAYNTNSHSSTELSLFEIMVGENPLTASDFDIVGALFPTLTASMTKLFQQLCDRAQNHIQKAKWHQKYYAGAKRRAEERKVVDHLWFGCNIYRLPTSALSSNFCCRGPFAVTERIGTVTHRLALPLIYECHNLFHVSQLVPHHPRSLALVPQEAAAVWPPTLGVAGNLTEQYVVDYIVEQLGTGADAQDLVKWCGAPEGLAT